MSLDRSHYRFPTKSDMEGLERMPATLVEYPTTARERTEQQNYISQAMDPCANKEARPCT